MTEPLPITPTEAARLLEEQPLLRLDVTVLEADALIAELRTSGSMGLELLAEKLRLQALPQAMEICQRVALLNAPLDTATPQ